MDDGILEGFWSPNLSLPLPRLCSSHTLKSVIHPHPTHKVGLQLLCPSSGPLMDCQSTLSTSVSMLVKALSDTPTVPRAHWTLASHSTLQT